MNLKKLLDEWEEIKGESEWLWVCRCHDIMHNDNSECPNQEWKPMTLTGNVIPKSIDAMAQALREAELTMSGTLNPYLNDEARAEAVKAWLTKWGFPEAQREGN